MFSRAVTLLLSVAIPALAGATELEISAESSVQYQTNAFRSDDDKADDVSFRFGPVVEVHDSTRKLGYDLRYRPVYEKFVNHGSLDKLSHFANGQMTYAITDRTLISLSDKFSVTQSTSRGDLVDDGGGDGTDLDPVPDTEVRRDNVYINQANVSLRHNFTPRMVGQFSGSYDYFDSERDNTAQRDSFSGIASLTYALSASDRVGVGGGLTFQDFQGVTGQPGSQTWIYRGFLSWIHEFGETTELSARVGPAWIDTNQDNPSRDRTGLPRYLQYAVVGNRTVKEIYDDLGLDVSNDLMSLTGSVPGLESGDVANFLVPAGSFVIPNQANCPRPGQVTDFGAFTDVETAAGCAQTVFVINDPSLFAGPTAAADAQAEAEAIAFLDAQPPIDLFFVNGSSPSGSDDSTLTLFGEVSLSHHWTDEIRSSVSYSRSENSASSLGSTTIADRVSLVNTWKPSIRWNLSMRGDWVQRKSANDITNVFNVVSSEAQNFNGEFYLLSTYVLPLFPPSPTGGLQAQQFNNSIDTQYWSISARAAYRMTKNATVSLRLTYQNQDTKRASTSINSTFENVIAFLGFRYDFDPFHF